MLQHHCTALALFAAATLGLAGCTGDNAFATKSDLTGTVRSEIEGDVRADVSGHLNSNIKIADPVEVEVRLPPSSLRIEGPIQVQMQLMSSSVRYAGTNVSDGLIEEVDVGKTTDDWILAVFGEPDFQADLQDGTTIWRYSYRPITQQASGLEVFGKSDKEPELATRTVCVQFRDRIVIKIWQG